MRIHSDKTPGRSSDRHWTRLKTGRHRRRGAALLIIVVMLLLIATAATKAMIENQITDRRSHTKAAQADQLQRALSAASQFSDDELSGLRLPVANPDSESDKTLWIEFQIESITDPDASEMLIAVLTDSRRELGRGAAPRNEPFAGDSHDE